MDRPSSVRVASPRVPRDFYAENGVSYWAKTSRIDVELDNGTSQSFFIKVIPGDNGRQMTCGEFESMQAIYSTVPEFAPKPIACGTYDANPDTYFFLCEFRDMTEDMPDPHKFSARLAALHQESKSPSGKFGFHVTTYSGNLPQMNDWEDSWETYFTKNLKLALELELAAKGSDPEFEVLLPVLFDTVIPRLLRPMKSNGRSVKPSLVHGDLWYANSGFDVMTGDPLIFDACSFYAHNEYEFGQWRPAWNRFGTEYLDAYHALVPKAEPVEDYDGRIDLYKLRFNTHVSALFTEDLGLREQ
ncbi:Uu.00g100400.m01.CDS01 [Anthostomella pinea]|uniref:protein-ribulosamine 3-kinase n=1 Tax=Anthostomella pinea TaxID=933095 RepID=A0AAI8VDZ1_9PEZI|nr:Uu.00g100400.m01.CDS01 [Anthostomella pinea]